MVAVFSAGFHEEIAFIEDNNGLRASFDTGF